MIKFSTYSLRSPEMALVPDNANEVESKKFELEFEEYQKKLKQQKDDWAKQNPEQVIQTVRKDIITNNTLEKICQSPIIFYFSWFTEQSSWGFGPLATFLTQPSSVNHCGGLMQLFTII